MKRDTTRKASARKANDTMPRKDGRTGEPTSARRGRPARAVAPWVRTRLRTAPGTAAAFALLVLVTAFLAAALPRTVDRYETEGLRHDIVTAPPRTSVLDITAAEPSGDVPPEARATVVAPERLAEKRTELLELLPAPLRFDLAQSAHGVRTTQRIAGLDPWLPKPSGLPPEFTLTTLPGLDRHTTVREGRLPTRAEAGRSSEVAVTRETAKSLHLKVGSVVHLPERFAKEPLALTVVGIVEPRRPQGSYWSADPLLRTPVLASKVSGGGTYFYWQAGLLLPPPAATTLLASTGEPEVYWRFAADASELTAQDAPRLTAALASVSAGPDLVRIRATVGGTASASSGLDEIVEAYDAMRSAITPVVAVAAFGIGTVAAVVLAMTGGLFAARRAAELALLRARGGSLAGIGVRLLGETGVLALPATALGLLLATLTLPEARFLPALAAAGAVGLLAGLALPLRALFLHRRPLAHGGREDLADARPSQGRTIAELTVLVLAVGAVVALRRRGTGDSGDYLVSSAPVLVALIAALVLVRLYPLPLRWAARPARRLRGAVGFLSLARAGRSSATGALPLLALLVALSTAAFGGSVLSGVSEARDRAALLETGADARVTGNADLVPLTDGLVTAVRRTAGVTDVTTAQVEYDVELPSGTGRSPELKSTALLGVDPESYARLADRTGYGPFPPELLTSVTGQGSSGKRILPAIASPAVAERLGTQPRDLAGDAGEFAVRIVAVRTNTPALPEQDFLLVNGADLPRGEPTVLLATGSALDGTALRKAVTANSSDFSVVLRTERRAAYVDSPMQTGAERIYLAAIGAGAGYAVLALLLSLMQSAPERATLLARLRTMGLTRRQGRRLLGFEALPQALLAAAGGALVGWATILLLAPGVDLVRLSLAAPRGVATLDSAPLRVDAWSLVLPAASVLLLAALAAGLQAWWSGRTGSIKELRAGDAR
ncbi:FtsX-like permease family protein [Streptomyces sp. NPDC047981]|uniref:FtsX-like permease family protein n=1 Tax=Streptomyces sp. NPDC047981 TaxID=3154610 RepID=UPI0034412840